MIFFSTLLYTCSSCTKFIIRRPLSLEFITTSAFADFFDDFPEFLTCSKASIGTKDGKTEKSSENRLDSSGGKLSKHVLLRLVWSRTCCSVTLERLSLSSFAMVYYVAAIRVRIVNLVSVIGYCIECFYSEYKKRNTKSEKLSLGTCNTTHITRKETNGKTKYRTYFSTRSFFNPCWFSFLHLSQNFSCGIAHLPTSSELPTDEHGISSGVRFKLISYKTLSSMTLYFPAQHFNTRARWPLGLASMQLPVMG